MFKLTKMMFNTNRAQICELKLTFLTKQITKIIIAVDENNKQNIIESKQDLQLKKQSNIPDLYHNCWLNVIDCLSNDIEPPSIKDIPTDFWYSKYTKYHMCLVAVILGKYNELVKLDEKFCLSGDKFEWKFYKYIYLRSIEHIDDEKAKSDINEWILNKK